MEFALILPILLLLLMGIIEFGYVLTAYTSLFNAAREGSRYGAVSPWYPGDVVTGARQKVFLVNPDNADIAVCCDMGPGTEANAFYCNVHDYPNYGGDGNCPQPQRPEAGNSITNTLAAQVGDRVVVDIAYDLPTITPIIHALWPSFRIETEAARTIASVGEAGLIVLDTDGEGGDDGDDETGGTPGISVSKTPDSQTVYSGEAVTFTILVANIGEVDLENVTVTDAQAPNCDKSIGNLSVGGFDSYTCVVENVTNDFTNIAQACGTYEGDTVCATSQSANVTVIIPGTPAIQINKTPDTQAVLEGEDVTFIVLVSNVGDVDLVNVAVTDPLVSNCNVTIGDLPAEQSYGPYTCVVENVTDDFTNIAQACGTYEGDTVCDSDDAVVDALAPIEITEPLEAGDPVVQGTAEEGYTVSIRDLMDPSITGDDTVGPDGFSFGIPDGLEPGHVIVVEGYGLSDSAVVQGELDDIVLSEPLCHGGTVVNGTAQVGRTVTLFVANTGYLDSVTVDGDGSFSFALFGGTTLQFGDIVEVTGYGKTSGQVVVEACTTDAYIVVTPPCGSGSTTIQVEGYNWSIGGAVKQIGVHWDGGRVDTITSLSGGYFQTSFQEDVASGPHTVLARTEDNKGDPKGGVLVQATFLSPCPSPNLVITGLELLTTGTISTYMPVDFSVTVENVGSMPVNSSFWVDIYNGAPVVQTSGVAWGAVSALGVGESTTLIITHRFDSLGTYQITGLADSFNYVAESDEGDNVGGPITVNVTEEGTPPELPPSGMGAIEGTTWVSLPGSFPVPSDRAHVKLLQGGSVIVETLSDEDAEYAFTNLQADTYTVIGETWIDSVLYTGGCPIVNVAAGGTATCHIVME